MDFEPDDFEDFEDYEEIVTCPVCGEEAMMMCGEDIQGTEGTMMQRDIRHALDVDGVYILPSTQEELVAAMTMYMVNMCVAYWCYNCGHIVDEHHPDCPNPYY